MHSDWYDWFGAEVQKKYNISIEVLDMPNWNQPDVDESVAFLLSRPLKVTKSTYFIGHSVGCQALIRYLIAKMELDKTAETGGILLVAGWFNVSNPWGTIMPWVDNEDLHYQTITERIGYKKVVLSDNDPFTPDFKGNQRLWADRLGADSCVYPNRAHFNDKTEPHVFEEFVTMMNARPIHKS